MVLLLLCCIFALLSILRIAFVLQQIRSRRLSLARPPRSKAPIKTLVVLGSGGHTTEMLQLLSNLDPHIYAPMIYVVADTDDTSERRYKAAGGRQPDVVFTIPRSREVGQSYLSSIGSTLYSFVFCCRLVFRIRPNLLLCNGPGTCLPVAICTLFYRILGWCEGNLVFVESFCRVGSLSLTGRLLYPVADLFVVHWDELHARYPRSTTVSTFVPNKSKFSWEKRTDVSDEVLFNQLRSTNSNQPRPESAPNAMQLYGMWSRLNYTDQLMWTLQNIVKRGI